MVVCRGVSEVTIHTICVLKAQALRRGGDCGCGGGDFTVARCAPEIDVAACDVAIMLRCIPTWYVHIYLLPCLFACLIVRFLA